MQVRCSDTASDPARDVERGCIPGCQGRNSKPWCSRQEANLGKKAGGCAFQPADLDDMMRTHAATRRGYNEVVVDARVYKANLPFSLEAIVGDRDVHAAFMRQYPELDAMDVPLVSLGAGGFKLA